MKAKIFFTAILCLMASVSFSQLKSLAALSMTDEQKEAEAEQERLEAAKFAGRPDTPGAEIANYNDNIPAKKETFESKMARFKEEGFEVAVVLVSGGIYTKGNPSDMTKSDFNNYHNISLDGNLPSMASNFEVIREAYIAKMNKAFNTDVFVPVDMKDIPYIEIKGHKKDDWGVTKYRIYVNLYIQPQYIYGVANAGKKSEQYTSQLTITASAPIYELYNDKSKVKIKQHILNSYIGDYSSDKHVFDAKPEVETIEELAAMANLPSNEDVVTKLKEDFDTKIDKYVSKVK